MHSQDLGIHHGEQGKSIKTVCIGAQYSSFLYYCTKQHISVYKILPEIYKVFQSFELGPKMY